MLWRARIQRLLLIDIIQGRSRKLVAYHTTWRNGNPVSYSSTTRSVNAFSALGFAAEIGKPEAGASDLKSQLRQADDLRGISGEQGVRYGPSESSQGRRAPRPRIHDPGVQIDRHGQLTIVNHEASQRKLRTALVLSSASTNLVADDFRRLASEKSNAGHESLSEAIPGRDEGFKRLPYWIILLGSPAHAASYQHRLRWYHQNAQRNIPVNPFKAATTRGHELPAHVGYIDSSSGEDVWKRMHQYTLLPPSQDFSVTAMLPPFPEPIPTILHNHGRLLKGGWPVRIWVDGIELDDTAVRGFLSEDGRTRAQEWKILDGQEGTEALDWQMVTKHGGIQSQVVDFNWLVRFRTEEEAMRFWRTWHLRPFPACESNALVHVDMLY